MEYSLIKSRVMGNLETTGFDTGPDIGSVSYAFNIMPPVFYLVRIVDTEAKAAKDLNDIFVERIKRDLSQYSCSNIVYVNVYVCKENSDSLKVKFESFENDMGEKVHNVNWIYDCNKDSLIFPYGQPDKLMGIEKCFCVSSGANISNGNIKIYNNRPYLTYFIIAANIIVWAYINFFGGTNVVYSFGGSREGLLNGELYRLVTPMFIHSEAGHLFFNCFSLYIFGRETEKILSRVNFIFIYLITGVLSSFFSAVFSTNLSIGASGAIFGVIGALAAVSRIKKYKTQLMDYFTILLYIIVSIGMGFSQTNIDNCAHIAGAVSGFIIEYVYINRKNKQV
ncbi:rhomboid family intramembrane serine protease [Lachnospiraceae bacterium NSJ-143]|nr:rhomboid family intramembrane serine protease [Lachnospiraceae bacterium NSJ-143]